MRASRRDRDIVRHALATCGPGVAIGHGELDRAHVRREDTIRWYESTGVPDSVPAPDRARTLELFGYEACGYCRRVLRVLERMPEVEVTFRDTWREPGAGRTLRERTGRGQVPCLFVDGEALFESEDIVRWLEAYQEWLAATPA